MERYMEGLFMIMKMDVGNKQNMRMAKNMEDTEKRKMERLQNSMNIRMEIITESIEFTRKMEKIFKNKGFMKMG